MPVKRRAGKRREEIPETIIAFLRDEIDREEIGFFDLLYLQRDLEVENPDWGCSVAQLWAELGAEIVANFANEYPGHRPYYWWTFDAPRVAIGNYPGRGYDDAQPRLRLGGIGTPAYEVLAHVPRFDKGLPLDWVSEFDVQYYGPAFRGIAIDPLDPPKYESEAAYLKRHDLLLPGELRRLTAEDFVPEVIGG